MLFLVVLGLAFLVWLLVWLRRVALGRSARGGFTGGKGYYTYAVHKKKTVD